MSNPRRLCVVGLIGLAVLPIAGIPASAADLFIGLNLDADSLRTGPGRPADPPAAHRHAPVEIVGEPIVTRLAVSPERPRRLLVDPEGNVYVADAGKVLRLPADASTTFRPGLATLADGLDEPSGLARDGAGNLYVSIRAGDRPMAGSIVRINPSGKRTVIAAGLSGPGALAIDERGTLYVANPGDDTIAAVDPQGAVSVLARSISSPAGLALGQRGDLFVVSDTEGTLWKISPDGSASVLASGLGKPCDLAVGPEGEVVVCTRGGKELIRVDAEGSPAAWLSVPSGTTAVAFDADGNLLAASETLRIVVRITTRLSVPCPHCDERIPLWIVPRKMRAPTSRSVL